MKLDALVLLGCRVSAGDELAGAAARRTERAAGAYREGVAPLVVASGGRRWGGVCEADAMARELERRGVPSAAIVRELLSLSTAENAYFSAELLEERGLRRVGVVTCEWHLRRALVCFERAGLEACGIAVPSPQAAPHQATWRAARETFGWWLDKTATWGWRAR